MDPVEKLRQIQIYHDPITRFQMRACLGHGLLCSSALAKGCLLDRSSPREIRGRTTAPRRAASLAAPLGRAPSAPRVLDPRRRLAWEPSPGVPAVVDNARTVALGGGQKEELRFALPHRPPSGRQCRQRLCCAPPTAEHGRGCPRPRSVREDHPQCRSDLVLCPWLVAARPRALGIRPSAMPSRPFHPMYRLERCRQAPRSVDQGPVFSHHPSLCSAVFQQLHRSYEGIRLLWRLQPGRRCLLPDPHTVAPPEISPGKCV